MKRRQLSFRATISRLCLCCLLLSGLALLDLLATPQKAQADGGAPNLAYVAGARQGIGIIDVAQQKLARQFSIAGNPYMTLLSPDGSLLYVTQPALGRVAALATKTGQQICSASFPGQPALLALNFDGTIVYVAGLNETTILALNSQTCALQRSFQAPGPISWLAVAGITTTAGFQEQLWVAESSAVSILSEQSQLLDSISIPAGPRFLCLPGSLTAYVATRHGSLLAVDMLSHQVFATLLTNRIFGSMDYDAVTGNVYVPDQQHNQLDVISPVLNGSGEIPSEPARVIPLSAAPHAIAVTNDGAFGFVALSDGSVAMLDIPAHRLINSVHVGGDPRFIITGPYPPQHVPIPQPSSAQFQPIYLVLALAALLILGALAFWLIRRRYHG